MAKFAYIEKNVTLFQRHLNTIRADKAARKEAPMPLQKSMSDLAWEAFSAAARALVTAKTFRTYGEAVDALKAASHPAYLTYLASLSSGSPPPATTAPGDVVKVVKQAQDVQFAKKRQVQQEINKRTTALVRSGKAENELEALRAVFKSDPALYEDYRQSSYARGPIFPDTAPAPVAEHDLPAYATAKRLALDLKLNDPWGEHSGKTQQELVNKVLRDNPQLYEAVRQESYAHNR